MALLDDCKTALRITTNAYDSEISSLIDSAKLDLGIAGVETATVDALVETAIKTYVRVNFPHARKDADVMTKLQERYNEQKAQLMNASGYTDWGVSNE